MIREHVAYTLYVRPYYLLIALITLTLFSGCSFSTHAGPALPSEEPRWFSATSRPVRGVVLVVHGLNLRPSALDPICHLLAKLGYHSYRMTLTGHNDPTSTVFDSDVWVRDVERAYASVRSEFPELPTYTLGYSLGGLLITHLVDSLPPHEHPSAVVLLAPALALRTALDIPASLDLVPTVSWRFSNLAPRAYRRYPTTPLFWYANTIAIYRKTQALKNPDGVKLIPALIALNPHDELVSQDGVIDWIAQNKLTPRWRTMPVLPKATSPGFAEHVVLDEPSLGPHEWIKMTTAIQEFLMN